MLRVELLDLEEWREVGDAVSVEEADRMLVASQMAALSRGRAVEGRIVDSGTGEVVHEHCAPRRVMGWN